MTGTDERNRYQVVDPDVYFSTWHFVIHRELWPALGVTRREYVDREKTRTMRVAAKARGVPASRLPHVKATYFAHAVSTPPQYDFHEGYVFYSRRCPRALQVAVVIDLVEVHVLHGYTYLGACRMTADELAKWLQTGDEPSGKRISRNESWRELAKYYILPPDDDWIGTSVADIQNQSE